MRIVIPSLPGYDKLNELLCENIEATTSYEEGCFLHTIIGDRTFAENVNRGLLDAVDEYEDVLILNNDVTLLPGWHQWLEENKHRGILSLTPQVDCGWGFFVPKEILQTVGYLDEQLENSYEDYDYFIRAALLGYKRIPSSKVFALHEGGHTINNKWGQLNEQTPRRLEMCKRNRRYMLDKWPDVDIDRVPLESWNVHSVDIMKEWKQVHA